MTQPTAVHSLIRRTHEERVLSVLREHGALSRSEIASRVGLSRATLSEITNMLLDRGAVVVINTDALERAGSGRPAERLALDPASGQFMGVDFGHRRVTVAVADASHEIVASGSTEYTAEHGWPERVRIAFDLIERLSEETGVHYGALQGIGVGVPGPFSARVAPAGARESGWVRYDASDAVDAAFAERFGAPVVIDNNTRFAALAEAISSSGDNVQHLMYVRLSDGVGGGLIIDGRLVTGSARIAGEFGHVTVDQNGTTCRCGKRGCLETVASVPAILASCRARGVAVETTFDLLAAVGVSDPIVDEVLREAASALGRVLGAAAMTLNPSEIVLAGEIVKISPVILQQVIAVVTYELSSVAQAAPIIRISALPENAGALGAIAALFRSSPLLASYPAPLANPSLSTASGIYHHQPLNRSIS